MFRMLKHSIVVQQTLYPSFQYVHIFSLSHFHFVVVEIGFEDSMYTIMEQDDVEVCIVVFTGNLAPGIFLEFNVQTEDDSALGMSIKGQCQNREEGVYLVFSVR